MLYPNAGFPLADVTNDHVTLTLPSELGSIEVVEQTAEKFALRAGFDESTACSIAMVSREAAVNAVIHGNRYDPQKSVNAKFALHEGKLAVTIADQGPGLDPDTIPDPLAPENLLRSSGRGVFLMRAIMDEVHFRQLDPGTEVTLIKHTNVKEADE